MQENAEAGKWDGQLDRFRYSPEQLFIRLFRPQSDYCVIIQLLTENNVTSVTMYGNNRDRVQQCFKSLFMQGCNGDLALPSEDEMRVSMREWSASQHDLLYFAGSVHAAYSAWGRVLVERQLQALAM